MRARGRGPSFGPHLAHGGSAQGRGDGSHHCGPENLDVARQLPTVGLCDFESPETLRDDVGSVGNPAGNEKIENGGAGLHLA